MSEVGTKRRKTRSARMSALGGKSGLDMLTARLAACDPSRSSGANFAVMHSGGVTLEFDSLKISDNVGQGESL